MSDASRQLAGILFVLVTLGVSLRSPAGRQGPGHGRVRMARNIAVSSGSAGGSTRWNQ
jgi:hypothetical protein